MTVKIIPKWLFQTSSAIMLIGSIGLAAYWEKTESGLFRLFALALTGSDGTYDLGFASALTFLVLLIPCIGLVFLLRVFSKMPTMKEQLAKDTWLSGLVAKPQPQLADTNLASGWRRVAAFIIDRGVVLVVLALSAGATVAARENLGGPAPVVALVLFLVILAAAVFYAYARDAFRGRSLGRLMLGMRVVDAETREPIGAWRSFKREITLHVAPMPFIELALIFFSADRRRLGDKWAKTIVVRTDKAARP